MDPEEQSAAPPAVTALPQAILTTSGAYAHASTTVPTPNEAEVCRLYELTDGNNAGHRNVFVLGTLSSRAERIAVISQQTRAINLIHCLFASGRWSAGQRVCVIGGGAAGLTAAAYAINKGAQVTVLEWNDLLWNLRGCRTRWLHPNLTKFWESSPRV